MTIRPYACPRADCDSEFDTSTERVDHLENAHGEEYADIEQNREMRQSMNADGEL